ncbi:MAG: peptidoglycan DD-metalloendopeptidase family protein [Robiginitomaculum sp.]
MLRFALLLILLGLPNLAYAQSAADNDKLSEVTKAQEQAEAEKARLDAQRRKAEVEIKRLRAGLIDAAAQAQSYEKASSAASRKLTDLTGKSRDLTRSITADRESMADLLSALQRLERTPPPPIAVMPKDASKAAQAAMLLTAVTQALAERSAMLAAKLETLEQLEGKITGEKSKLEESERDLDVRRASISKSVKEKTALEASIAKRSKAQDRRIATLAGEAEDLRALISAFEARSRSADPRVKPAARGSLRGQSGAVPYPRTKPRADRPPEPYVRAPDTDRFADARGSLRAPVRGRIISKYNTSLKDGSRSKGYKIATSANAQVIAPYTGRIAFVGPFKSYGNVVMLNVGEGYFIVLTGMGTAHGHEGDIIEAGEPIGTMGARLNSELYIEFWKNGTPVNPAPWLATAYAKMR